MPIHTKVPSQQIGKAKLIFGTRAIIEHILVGRPIDKIFINKVAKSPLHKELITRIKQHQIPYSQVPIAKLNRITPNNHQGAIAFVAPIAFASLSHVVQASYEKGKNPLILILDSITDVKNLGAIVRTAVCTEVDTIVVSTQGSASIGGDAMKTSAGALAHLPICRVASLKKAIYYLQESGLQIVACHEKATEVLYDADLRIPSALLMGAEGKGIRPEYLKMAAKQIHIPMLGPISSLNVAVAAAVMMYESMRQRKFLSHKL